MRPPEIVSGNIFIRPNPLAKKGEKVDGHKHNFDHTTFVIRGSVHVKAKLPDGTIKEKDFEAGDHFLVRAEVEHEIEALEDNSLFYCIYSHRDPQGKITQVNDGWSPAYE